MKQDLANFSALKPPVPVDAVFFDYDGTLFNTLPLIFKSYRRVYKLYEVEKSDSEILAGIGLPLEEVFLQDAEGIVCAFEAKNGIKPTKSDFRKDSQRSCDIRDLAEEMTDHYVAYSGPRSDFELGIFIEAMPMLKAVEEMDIPMAIVTSRRLAHLRKNLDSYALSDKFDCLTGRFETRSHKPNPEPILRTMREMNLQDPSKVLYVGDSVHDIQCAKNAGALAAFVEWTAMPKEELIANGADFMIKKGVDIAALICNHNR